MYAFTEKIKTTQQTMSAKSTLPAMVNFAASRGVDSIFRSQRTIGNQTTQRLLQTSASELEMEGLEEVTGADDVDQDVGVPMPAPPPAPPAAPPPPAPAAPFTVTVPARIRSASTPIGMPDRLPPRVNTPAVIGINGWHPPMLDVTISVEGVGGGNGSVTINGANSVDLTTSATVQLRGVTQTDPGNAGRLRLVARQGTTLLGSSAGFSVSSIPQNFSVSFHSQISDATMRGLRVNNHWESDSGNVADLDEAERSEQVQYGAATGIWAGVVGGANSGYLPANSPRLLIVTALLLRGLRVRVLVLLNRRLHLMTDVRGRSISLQPGRAFV